MAWCIRTFILGRPSKTLNGSNYRFRVPFLPLLVFKLTVSYLVYPTSGTRYLTYEERMQVISGNCTQLHTPAQRSSTPATVSNKLKMSAVDTGMSTNDIVTDPYLQSVLEASTHTRQQCTSLIDLAEANTISASRTSSLDVQLELSKQQRLVHSYLGQLRGLNRNAIAQVRNTKQLTAEARQEIDRLHLQLQNLYYEERHLRGEIAACESYE